MENKQRLVDIEDEIVDIEENISLCIERILSELESMNFITKTDIITDETLDTEITTLTSRSTLTLTPKGEIASRIQELNPLVFADVLHDKMFDNLSVEQILTVISMFISFNVSDEYRSNTYKTEDPELNEYIERIVSIHNKHYDRELSRLQSINESDYVIQYDLMCYVYRWCCADNEESCKLIIQDLKKQDIFLGTFVKAILKLNNIACELTNVAKYMNDIQLMHKLSKVSEMTLKFVITNQSLYV